MNTPQVARSRVDVHVRTTKGAEARRSDGLAQLSGDPANRGDGPVAELHHDRRAGDRCERPSGGMT